VNRIGNAALKLTNPGATRALESRDETLAQRICKGVKAGEFGVAFQPVVHAQTLKPLNVECLLRWHHPEYGLLLPECFLSAFEDRETARVVTAFVLETVCLKLGELRRDGQTLAGAAINIQPSQLLDEALAVTIRDTTHRHGIDPSLLELELVATEDTSTLLSTREFTRSLRELGVRLALSDFGSDYSPLAMLGVAQIDTVKLARKLMARVPGSERDCILMTGLLDLLDKLDMRVVVEGVESEAQLSWFKQRADVYVQGYHVARPQANLADALTMR
jgi:EAL domain-containing protein (putative c-di-GMP-specific phosphodiesterase class I)